MRMTAIGLAAGLWAAAAHGGPLVEVTKTASCGCCAAWVAHMEAAGFEVVAEDVTPGLLARAKIAAGIAPEHASCHTARVEGYVVEGHVPAAEVSRLLAERPEALGLAVPGMPIGSPGMEMGATREPYEVLLLRRDGTAEVFARRP